jgi:hypothetical protein
MSFWFFGHLLIVISREYLIGTQISIDNQIVSRVKFYSFDLSSVLVINSLSEVVIN